MEQERDDLNRLKKKWDREISNFIVESAFYACDMNLERANAALEVFYQETRAASWSERFKMGQKFQEIDGEETPKHDPYPEGKPRYDLLPPEALEEVVQALTWGVQAHGARNWETGQPWGSRFAKIMRHCWEWMRGVEKDKETGLNPLAHAIVQALFLLTYQIRGIGEDDRGLKAVSTSGRIIHYEKSGAAILTQCPDPKKSCKVGSIACTRDCEFMAEHRKIQQTVNCSHKEAS